MWRGDEPQQGDSTQGILVLRRKGELKAGLNPIISQARHQYEGEQIGRR